MAVKKASRTTKGGKQALAKTQKPLPVSPPPRDTFLRSPRTTSSRLSNVDGGTTAKVRKILQGPPVSSREVAVKLGIGQKGALYHLTKLRGQRLATYDTTTRLWKAEASPNTLNALLKQLRFILELSSRAKLKDRPRLAEVADTLSEILSRDFGVHQTN